MNMLKSDRNDLRPLISKSIIETLVLPIDELFPYCLLILKRPYENVTETCNVRDKRYGLYKELTVILKKLTKHRRDFLFP